MNAQSISVNVLTQRNGPDCTNYGITRFGDRFVLFANRAAYAAALVNDAKLNPNECLIVVRRTICGTEYVHAAPAMAECPGMAGGNFVHTCDSRFAEVTGLRYPISVHDRFETSEENETLSR